MRVTMRQIATEVAQRHGLTLEDLTGPMVTQTYARPRHEAMALIRAQTKFSLPQIGRFFNRDHTSVVHALRRMAAMSTGDVESCESRGEDTRTTCTIRGIIGHV